MLADIDGSSFVGSRFVVNNKFVGIRQNVGNSHLQISRKTFFSVFAQILEHHAVLVFQRLTLPQDFVKGTRAAAVQSVWPVILWQRVGLAIERESTIGNAVRVAPDDRSNIGRIRDVSLSRIVTKHDVGKLAITIRNTDRLNDAAIVHGSNFDTVSVLQGVQDDGPLFQRSEALLLYSRCWFVLLGDQQSADRNDQRSNY